MSKKIAVITTEFLKDFLGKSFNEIDIDCEFKIYTYDTFEDIKKIYQNISVNIDGILTSGIFPEQVIKKNFPENKFPIVYFNTDDAAIYRLFFMLLYENRDLDINRIYADPLGAFNIDLKDYLQSNHKLNYSEVIEPIVKNMSLEELRNIEKEQFEKHLNLWNKGDIDISVTRFSSLMEPLRKAGIMVYFPFPSYEYLKSSCMQLCKEIDILKMKENQPGAINITIENSGVLDMTMEKKYILLHEALLDFNGNSLMEYVIQRNAFGFEILTNRKSIEEKTLNYTSCTLKSFLKDRLDFKVYIGYGIGNDMYQGRMNAIDANREAVISQTGGSFLINNENELIGPLDSENNFIVQDNLTDKMKSLTKNIALSPMTVRRVITAFNSISGRELTARELAAKLSITQRSANRFLSAMEKGNMIKIVEERRITTKGRPERVYKLMDDYQI